MKLSVDGTSVSIAHLRPKSSGIPQLSKSNSTGQNNSVPPPQQNKIQQSSPKVGLLSPNVVKDIKGESNGTGVHDQAKPSAAKEKVNPLPASKKKSQNDKSSSGSGGSLANLWGRASTKAKPGSAAADNLISNSTGLSHLIVSSCCKSKSLVLNCNAVF